MENGVIADQLPTARWGKGSNSRLRGNCALIIDLPGHKIATGPLGSGLLTPWPLPFAVHALHWAREHWLNAVAITAIAGVATALGPLVIRWLDRRSGKHAGNDELSAPDMSAGPHAAPQPQPSVARLHDIVEDLRYLMGNLERAVSELTAAPDVHRRDLKVRSSLGEEVRGAGRQLEVTLRLLEADGRLEADISQRVDAALHQRWEAEHFEQEMLAHASPPSSAEGGPTRPSPLPRPSPTRKRQTRPEDRRRRVGRR